MPEHMATPEVEIISDKGQRRRWTDAPASRSLLVATLSHSPKGERFATALALLALALSPLSAFH